MVLCLKARESRSLPDLLNIILTLFLITFLYTKSPSEIQISEGVLLLSS